MEETSHMPFLLSLASAVGRVSVAQPDTTRLTAPSEWHFRASWCGLASWGIALWSLLSAIACLLLRLTLPEKSSQVKSRSTATSARTSSLDGRRSLRLLSNSLGNGTSFDAAYREASHEQRCRPNHDGCSEFSNKREEARRPTVRSSIATYSQKRRRVK